MTERNELPGDELVPVTFTDLGEAEVLEVPLMMAEVGYRAYTWLRLQVHHGG